MNLFKRIFSSKPDGQAGPILPADQFRAIVLHECARCDRNSHQFTLISVDLRQKGGGRGHRVNTLTRDIIRRTRTTDEVGWLDDNTLGIFLPETGGEGARCLAESILKGQVYQTYTYPHLPGACEHERKDHDDRRDGGCATPNSDRRKDRSHPEPPHPALHRERIRPTHKEDQVSFKAPAPAIEELLLPDRLPLWKRAIDIAWSIALLAVLAPLFIMVALYIKLVSPGPVFFRQERVGYLGKGFMMWKFRTMHMNSDNVTVHKNYLKDLIHSDKVMTKLDADKKDNRLIPLAGLLRRTCIDELPQLFNVLSGDMTLVGPRPCLAYEAEEFQSWQRRRFHTFPGMTGLWQVSGKNRLTFSQMMRLDVRYTQKRSFWLDMIISLRTVPAILGQVSDMLKARFVLVRQASRALTLWIGAFNTFIRQLF